MKNIYLVGFMGTGKTTVGKILASRLSKKFIEMDEVIEKEEGRQIKDIFNIEGESYFRGLENNLLKKISFQSDLVVSCGGGLVCNLENLEILKKTGYLFCLFASPSLVFERVKSSLKRPLLNVEDPLAKINELIKLRKPYYNQITNRINTDKLTPQEVADSILVTLNNG